MATLSIGCSGFSYRHWSGGVFYPQGLSQRKWLEYYCTRFNTVELNSTFHRLPPESSFEGWRNRTPEGFRFAVKGSRLITHIRRVKECGDLVVEFMGRAKALGEKLGVILWQLPPDFHADGELKAQLARLLKGTALRHAFEFRHPGWLTPEIDAILSDFGFARVVSDSRACPTETAGGGDFVYCRRHGLDGRYGTLYTEAALQQDALRMKEWLSQNRDVFVYFNNDAKGYAPRNAAQLLQMMS